MAATDHGPPMQQLSRPSSYGFSSIDRPASHSNFNSSTHALQPGRDASSPDQSYSAAAIPSSPGPWDSEGKVDSPPARAPRKKKLLLIALAAVAIILVIVILCVYFFAIRPKNASDGAASATNGSGGSTIGTSTKSGHSPSPTSKAQPTTGGDGSTITMEDGTTFVYRNSFGGYWVDDPNDPFKNGARPQSWSPALNETFHYGTDRIRG